MTDVLYEKRDGIAYVTFNRPEKMNSWTANSFVLLAEAWEDIQADDSVRVAILTGTGEDAFSSGGDLGSLIPLFTGAKQAETAEEKKFMNDLSYTDRALLKNVPLYKPVIAAINGLALGGGFEIIQATDIRIAASHATFALPEVKRGIVPGGGSMTRLIRQIGYAPAMEIMLTGDPINAEQALRLGIINKIVESSELLACAETTARRLCENGPLSMQAIKESAIRSSGTTMEEAFLIERELSGKVMASEDAVEGPRAFKEKRKAEFKGR
ncbi:MAG: enoyl-CoA hydratase-related protein [Pseudomonadales bacterium]